MKCCNLSLQRLCRINKQREKNSARQTLLKRTLIWVWTQRSMEGYLPNVIEADISCHQWTCSGTYLEGLVRNLLDFRSFATLELGGQTRRPLFVLFAQNIIIILFHCLHFFSSWSCPSNWQPGTRYNPASAYSSQVFQYRKSSSSNSTHVFKYRKFSFSNSAPVILFQTLYRYLLEHRCFSAGISAPAIPETGLP